MRLSPANCSFSGSATGPFGGKWQIEGTSQRDAGGRRVTGSLIGPDGKTIAFDRETQRGGGFLKSILRSGNVAR